MKVVAIILLLSISQTITSDSEENWDHDVYTGRHFNHLITSSKTIDDNMEDNLVTKSSLLVLYDESCVKKMEADKMSAANLPPAHLLVFAKYNNKLIEERVWYDLDDEDDLKDRYGFVECPDVLYFPKGTSTDRPVPWIQGESFASFAWRPFVIYLSVKNDLLEAVTVSVHGNGPPVQDVTIEPGVLKSIRAYVSHTFSFKQKESGKFLYGLGIEDKSKEKYEILLNDNLVSKFSDITEEQFLSKFNNKIQEKVSAVVAEQKKLASMYALGLKQPLLLPKFSDEGFDLKDISDEDFFSELQKYFKKKVIITHQHIDLEPNFNSLDVPIKYIELEAKLKTQIEESMLPVIQDFSDCPVVLHEVTGLYVLSTGTYIRPHVANPSGQVLTALIMLSTDDKNFALDLIPFSGDRTDIPFQAGTAIIYESSSVILNSQTSFSGKEGVLLYIYFKPTTKWSWTRSAEHVTDGYLLDNIYNLETDVTKKTNRKKNIRQKWQPDLHDEL